MYVYILCKFEFYTAKSLEQSMQLSTPRSIKDNGAQVFHVV